MTERKPEALPATCCLCSWHEHSRVLREDLVFCNNPERKCEGLTKGKESPPAWCPLREASKEKEHAE